MMESRKAYVQWPRVHGNCKGEERRDTVGRKFGVGSNDAPIG